jgi:uncharacterized repeat protein (TIGR03803 family)
MSRLKQPRDRASSRSTEALLVGVLMLMGVLVRPVQAQTFTLLHSFAGQPNDGQRPDAPVTLDAGGNLYGTTYEGGSNNGGTVYKLTHRNSAWLYSSLYSFQGNNLGHGDGANPLAGVTLGPDGAVYGTTAAGGMGPCDHNYGFDGCGTVFKLQPSTTICGSVRCPWNETVLYRFTGNDNSGDSPGMGAVVFDRSGNVYSTTIWGGNENDGTVFQLAPSNGGWTETVIHSLVWGDGVLPVPGVIMDASGDLYGPGEEGGGIYGCGTVFQIAPGQYGWTASTLFSFTCTPYQLPSGGIAFDPAGNIYGKFEGDNNDHGGVYRLTNSGYGWTMDVIHSFETSLPDGGWWQGGGPVFDNSSGNLYGTTFSEGAYGMGTVFKLTPGDYGWAYTSLHDFTGGSDGANPQAGLAIDAAGNLYGTTNAGGANNMGVVFEVTP